MKQTKLLVAGALFLSTSLSVAMANKPVAAEPQKPAVHEKAAMPEKTTATKEVAPATEEVAPAADKDMHKGKTKKVKAKAKKAAANHDDAHQDGAVHQ